MRRRIVLLKGSSSRGSVRLLLLLGAGRIGGIVFVLGGGYARHAGSHREALAEELLGFRRKEEEDGAQDYERVRNAVEEGCEARARTEKRGGGGGGG